MGDFEWPWQYNFPPFFTIQLNHETKNQQLQAWKLLVLDYTRAKKQSVMDIREAQRSSLFSNSQISRRLTIEGITCVMEELQRTGHAEPVDKTKTRWLIYWVPLEELASTIYKWISSNGMTGSVCTFYELNEGDSTVGEIFHGVSDDVLLKALKKLEFRKKAEVFGDNSGVKFF